MPRARKSSLRRAATLADVGRVAGVSTMAASAVLNGGRTSSRVAAATRERILAAATRLGYRRNAAAHALVNRRMHTIGVVFPIANGELNHYFLEVFNGILAAAARHEQNTTVFSLHNWSEASQRIGQFCDGRIDGMILVGTPFKANEVPLPAHTPFVSIHANHQLPGVINIESDEERGSSELVKLALALGHRRIMHITGPQSDVGVRRRIRGYKRALTAAGVDFDPDLLVPAQYRAESGREALRAWLDQRVGQPLPQMIYCGSDAIALGCLEVLAECGLRVPDDISIAGFDDTLAARIAMPQLASVRQPLCEMGSKAVDILLAQIDPRPGGVVPINPLVFPTKVIPRASLAVPRAETSRRI